MTESISCRACRNDHAVCGVVTFLFSFIGLALGAVSPDALTPEGQVAQRICVGIRAGFSEPGSTMAGRQTLGNEVMKLRSGEEWKHFASLYYLACVHAGDWRAAESAKTRLAKRDITASHILLLDRKLYERTCDACEGSGKSPTPCPACGGSGRRSVGRLTRTAVKCTRCKGEGRFMCPGCEGTGSTVNTAAVEHAFDWLLTGGSGTNPELLADLKQRSARETSGTHPQINRQGPVPGPPSPVPAPVRPSLQPGAGQPHRPEELRRNPAYWGKQSIVTGRATQVLQRMGGCWVVILEGDWRCRFRKGLVVDRSVQHRTVVIQGIVARDPDRIITAGAHMTECVFLLGF